MPHLPAAGRHRPDRLDLGLIVDFWVCVAMYGVIELVDRKWAAAKAACIVRYRHDLKVVP